MKKYFLAAVSFLLCVNVFSQEPWALIPKPDMGAHNTFNSSVQFKGYMYVAGENTSNGNIPVLRRTNDGNPGNWQDVGFNRGYRILKLAVSNEGSGYMFATVDTNMGNGEQSAVFRTMDGLSWQQISTFSSGNINNRQSRIVIPFKGLGSTDSLYVVYDNYTDGATVYRTSVDNLVDTNWTLVCSTGQLPGYNTWFNSAKDAFVWQNELYVLLEKGLIKSADGVNWQTVTTTNAITSIGNFSKATVFNNSVYVGLNSNNGAMLARTSDMINWSLLDNKAKPYSLFNSSLGTPSGVTAELNNVIYGTAYNGGNYNEGAIYSFDKNSNVLSLRKSFEYQTGTFAMGGLVLHPNGKMYGVASNGGSNESGTIFEFDPSIDTIIALHHFNAPDGSSPEGELLIIGNTLYGTSRYGGPSNSGVFFKYDITTLTFTKLFDFDGGITGREPVGGLTFDGVSKIFGVTPSGGANDQGTLYSFNILDSTFNVVYNFDGNIGSNPYYQPVFAPDGFLYGTTNNGINYSTCIYRFDTATSSLTKTVELNDYYQGRNALSKLILNSANNKFYFGVETSYSNYDGNLLEYDPLTSEVNTLINYNSYTGYAAQSIYWSGSDIRTICKNGGGDGYGTIVTFLPGVPNPLPGLGDEKFPDITALEVVNGELYLAAFGNQCGQGDRKLNITTSNCDDHLKILKSINGDNFIESYYISGYNEIPGRVESFNKLGVNIYGFCSNYYGSNSLRLCTSGITPSVQFPYQTFNCEGQALTLDAGNPGSTYSWNTGATSQTIDATNPGTYYVTVTSNDGCIAYAETQSSTHQYPDSISLITQQSHTLCYGDTLNAAFTSPDMYPDRVRFNGVDGFIEVYNIAGYLYDESYTVEVWVKPDTAGVVLTEQDSYNTIPGFNNNQIEIDGNGDVWMQVKGLDSINIGNIPFKQWSHLAIRYDAPNQTLSGFINGVKSNANSYGIRQKVFGSPYYGNEGFWFGKGDTTNIIKNSLYYKGRMANIKIWNTAITDSVILNTYQSLLGTSIPNLIVSYQMNDASGYLFDATYNYNGGSLYGDVILSGPSALTYEVSPIEGLIAANINSFSFSPNKSTTYVVTASTEFGCSIVDSIFIFVPEIKINADTLSFCQGSSVSLFVDSSSTPSWTPASGLSATDTAFVVASATFDVLYTVTDTLHNCVVKDSVQVFYYTNPFVNVFDVTLCAGSKVFMEGSSSDNGYWHPTLNIEDTLTPYTYVNGISSGIYYFTATNEFTGCSETDSMYVTVNALPSVNIGFDTVLCDNLPLTFDATTVIGYEFNWSSTDTSFTHQLDTIYTLNPSNNSYYLTVRDKVTDCYNYDTINVTANYTSYVDISDDTARICSGTAYELYANGSDIYSWTPANDLSSTTVNAPIVVPTSSRWFYLYATDSNGCESEDSVYVWAKTLPVIKGTVKYDSIGTEVSLNSGQILIFAGDIVGNLDTLLSIPVIAGQFFKDSIPAGLIALLSAADSASYYPNVPSIYYGGTDNWNNVSAVSAGCEDTLSLDILHSYIDPGFLNGIATIDGYLVEGIPFGRPGEPIRGIDIILEDVPGGGNQAFRKTDTSGYFAFNNVPDGNYQIRVNIPGREQDTVNYLFRVETDGGIVYDSTVVFYYNDTLIFIRDTTFMDTLNVDPTAVNSLLIENQNTDFKLYPNPGSGIFTIEVDNVKNISNEIRLYDINGRVITSRKEFAWINNKVVLDFRSLNLAPGAYYLKLNALQSGNKVLKLMIE